MIAPARTAAFHALRAIAENRLDLPAAIVQARTHLSDDRDRALTADIIMGTLRWQRSLDHLIEHFARRPLLQVDADVRTILRLSLYQLMHLDRVPASAVVDDAADLTRHARRASAAGFVNAVLRSVLRNRHRLPLPGRPGDRAERDAAIAYLGITHSHPDWLVSRWLDRHGFEAAERWVQFNNETPPLTVRANRLRLTREELAAAFAGDDIETKPTRYAPDGLVIRSGNPLQQPRSGSLWRPPSGGPASFVVQDEASQIVPLALEAGAGDRVLDLCASPGGKTTELAGLLSDDAVIVATDVRPRRVRILRDTVRASGAASVRILQVPGAGRLPFQPVFQRVLVDAPCSGLGTIRRDPDIRWRRHESDLPVFAARQLELLLRAAEVVAPGGRLVYATCSSEPEENEGVVDRFLAETRAFTPIDLRRASGVPDALIDDRGMLRTRPFAHGLEAFFAAALERR